MLSKLKAINLRAMREILNYRLVLSKALAIGQRIDYELWRTVQSAKDQIMFKNRQLRKFSDIHISLFYYLWLFMGVFILKKISMKEFHSPPLALQSDHTEYGDLTVFLSDFEASKSVNTHFDTMLKRAQKSGLSRIDLFTLGSILEVQQRNCKNMAYHLFYLSELKY